MIDQTMIADARELQELLIQQAQMMRSFQNKSDRLYSGFEDLVAAEGRPMQGEEFDPSEFPMAIRTKKECFHNAYHLAEMYDLTYVEGYTWYIIPILHAWCIDQNGRVIDPTLDDPEDYAYCGIPLNMDFVRSTMMSTGVYGVIDNWKDQFPMLDMDSEKYLHPDFK